MLTLLIQPAIALVAVAIVALLGAVLAAMLSPKQQDS